MTRPPIRNENYIRAGHHRIVFGLGVLFIGTLIHTVGTITKGWISIPGQSLSYGIFNVDANSNGAIISVRAFTILGIILGVVALILTGAYLKITSLVNRKKVASCILVTGIGAGGSSLIGALIFALEFYFIISVNDRNYSFALCIAGGVIIVAGSILIFLGARQHIRGQFSRGRIIVHGQLTSEPSAHIPYPIPDQPGSHVWHTQLFMEPPPAYNQLEHPQLSSAKQPPEHMLLDASPPSYSDAVKWYPKT